ncbi:hypothetical protein ASG87_05230 [Frateuria sp. Soil773]|uniref:DUF6445 family protein n=1 Tax=Frateuria sp. Soil773 TaxID=1736407 RepID=UPI0006F572BA|nr:DUF6445 family protein [Frateuria sp. Soil773]KRE88963.1 hypothetical protein ASG87_05230 [Frateuria sp. Soil773]
MSLFPQHPTMRPLPYRKPTEGRDYWVVDDVLPNPDEVRQRCLARTDWEYGYPHTGEVWPGMRATPALHEDELAALDARVCRLTGAKKVWVEQAGAGARLNHNCVQVVGSTEGAVKPHTDSLNLCRYAAVLYLNPDVPDQCGTSFYRQRHANGQLGGNMVMPPHRNLVDALGNRFVAPNAFAEDVRVPHRCNRLLLYKANIIHSASAYWGLDGMASKRMTAVFFWMA